jgi:uncharacterized Zn-finger protein
LKTLIRHFGFVSVSAASRYGVAKIDEFGGKCLVCGRSFTLFSNAKRHFRLVHLEEQSYECHICQKFYKGELGLRQHLRHTHGIYQGMVKDMQIPQPNN